MLALCVNGAEAREKGKFNLLFLLKFSIHVADDLIPTLNP